MAEGKKGSYLYVPPVSVANHAALRAVQEGTANADQQQRFFNWLLVDVCRLKEPSFIPGDAGETAFCEGRRFVGLYLAAALSKKNEPKGE